LKKKREPELIQRARKRFLNLTENYQNVQVKTLREIRDDMFDERDKEAFTKAVRALGFSWDDLIVFRRG